MAEKLCSLRKKGGDSKIEIDHWIGYFASATNTFNATKNKYYLVTGYGTGRISNILTSLTGATTISDDVVYMSDNWTFMGVAIIKATSTSITVGTNAYPAIAMFK